MLWHERWGPRADTGGGFTLWHEQWYPRADTGGGVTLWHGRHGPRADGGGPLRYGTSDKIFVPTQAGRCVMARAVGFSRRRRRGVTLWHERQDPRADAGGASLFGTRRCFPKRLPIGTKHRKFTRCDEG